MENPVELPAGTKADILKHLIKQELSAQDLAERLEVSATAVRQHLDILVASGLVARRKLAARPSRPTYLYRLSGQGARAFPRRYELLLRYLVEVLVDRHGTEGVAEILDAAGLRLAAEVRDRFVSAGDKARWKLLVDWLESELAWQADLTEEAPGRRRITIHQCPFLDASRLHPVVCGAFFRSLIRALYGAVPVEHQPAAGGLACCSLLVGDIGAPR
jgi:DeoR family transcriptional regulator, suf operon transcriptional repressor